MLALSCIGDLRGFFLILPTLTSQAFRVRRSSHCDKMSESRQCCCLVEKSFLRGFTGTCLHTAANVAESHRVIRIAGALVAQRIIMSDAAFARSI